VVELPYIVVTTGLFVNVFYWLVGLAVEPEKFFFYWAFFGLYITCTVGLVDVR
jgi:ABC-type multidrug transport system permease subunit